MPDEENGSIGETVHAEPQQPLAGDGNAASETEAAEQRNPDISENGNRALKIPDSLKPKQQDQDRFKGRISELVSARKAMEAENQRLRSELEQSRASSQKTQQNAAPQANGQPNPDQYDTYQEYIDALVEYKVDQRRQKYLSEQSEQTQKNYKEQKRSEFEEHAQSIVQQVPEFWDIVTDPSLTITEPMAEAVFELGELAPYAMYWLAVNRKEALRIAQLPDRSASVAIGRLAVQLEREFSGAGTDAETPATPDTPAQPQFHPKPVPQIRGDAPGNLDSTPSAKRDIRTWMVEEAERMRKKAGNPKLRVYIPN